MTPMNVNDRLSKRGKGMTEPEARPQAEEPRREPNLRIVYSNDTPIKPGKEVGRLPTVLRPAPLPPRQEAMLDRGLQARIGGMLREVFGDVAETPVPERFVKLLEALEKKERSSE